MGEIVSKYDNFLKGHVTLPIMSDDAKRNVHKPSIIRPSFT